VGELYVLFFEKQDVAYRIVYWMWPNRGTGSAARVDWSNGSPTADSSFLLIFCKRPLKHLVEVAATVSLSRLLYMLITLSEKKFCRRSVLQCLFKFPLMPSCSACVVKLKKCFKFDS